MAGYVGLTMLRSQVRTLRLVSSYRHAPSGGAGCYRSAHSTALCCAVQRPPSGSGSHVQNRGPVIGSRSQVLPPTHHTTCHMTHHVRGYAKKTKDKKGKKGGGGKPSVKLTENEMTEVVDLYKMQEEMAQALAQLQHHLVEKLSLRTNIGTFETLRVETPDGTFPLIQIGQVIQKSPVLIVISMDAAPHYSKYVQAALQKSNLNLNPQQDGSSFFVPLPKITREHREGLAKSAKQMCDKTKAQLKSVQNKYIRELNSNKDMSTDLKHNLQEHIHHSTKTFNSDADTMVQAKQKDLLGT